MIVPLLQRCTKEFQDAKQYRNDVRYLRVWIRYIDTVQACRRPPLLKRSRKGCCNDSHPTFLLHATR